MIILININIVTTLPRKYSFFWNLSQTNTELFVILMVDFLNEVCVNFGADKYKDKYKDKYRK